VLNASSALYLTHWARRFNRTGLQAGVFGMMYGAWGAAFSFVGPFAIDSMGLAWWMFVSGSFVLALSFAGIALLFNPPPELALSPAKQAPERLLTNRDILHMAKFWIFAVFFALFLTPGFGFKIIVQVLGAHLFHASTSTAALMAASFLSSYALGRLLFGLIADHFSLKPIYISFCVVQIVALLIMGFALPSFTGAAFFTVLMCLVGAMFAAGKSLWSVVLLRLYGPVSLHRALAMTLPVFGLAGFFGPITLNYAVTQSDLMHATRVWVFVMVGLLAVCTLLIGLLRGLGRQNVA
jgi:nitrate/nitrite transporter NarK